jgi:heme A synthase
MCEIGIGILANLICATLIFVYRKIKRTQKPKKYYLELKIIFVAELITGIASLIFALYVFKNAIAYLLLFVSSFFSFFSVSFIFFFVVNTLEITDNCTDKLGK